MFIEPPTIPELEDALLRSSNPIGMRMRAAYYLKQAYTNHNLNRDEDDEEDTSTNKIVSILGDGLLDVTHGSLMRHEFAYVMGQLRDERCRGVLETVLARMDDCVMVRHECAEALGAIGAEQSITILKTVLHDDATEAELAETCQLALNVMDWRAKGGDPETMPPACACMLNPYSSVDPAPPSAAHATMPFEDLGNILNDPDETMFERYRAMFSLRNRGGDQAVAQLCRALVNDESSSLLRHEIAYVLGQLQHPSSVEALEKSLRRPNEHKMVRHESAEALGAIEGRWEDVERILKEFCSDADDVVRESCLVALDAADYWGHSQAAEKPVNENLTDDSCLASFASVKADNRERANHSNIKAT
jgi:deoxyhypusine monooxygenase